MHHNLMRDWRHLREEGALREIDNKVYVCQQDNAWCCQGLTVRLFEIYDADIEQLNGMYPTGYFYNPDLFVGTFCEESKAAAKEGNKWLTPIGSVMIIIRVIIIMIVVMRCCRHYDH